jgi:hypothetical protein
MKWARTTVVFCLRRFVPSLREPEFTIENDVRHGTKHCPRFWPARLRVVSRRRHQLLQPGPRCADLNRASARRRSELNGWRAFGPGRLMSSPLAASTLNVKTSRSITAVWIGFIGSILGGLPRSPSVWSSAMAGGCHRATSRCATSAPADR